MSEEKDYTKYTFEKDTDIEIGRTTYVGMLQALQQLIDKFQMDFDKYKAMSNIIFAFLQKTDKDDKTIELKYNLFEFVDQRLREAWQNEVIYTVDLKFDLINEKGHRVKKKVKGKTYDEPFSPELTADPSNKAKPQTTVEGQTMLRILNSFQDVFRNNVDRGAAITFEELAESQMEVVDAEE